MTVCSRIQCSFVWLSWEEEKEWREWEKRERVLSYTWCKASVLLVQVPLLSYPIHRCLFCHVRKIENTLAPHLCASGQEVWKSRENAWRKEVMGAPDLKGNERRLSDWLLYLWPNTHPWIHEATVNSWVFASHSFFSLAADAKDGVLHRLNKLKPLCLVLATCTTDERKIGPKD